MGRNIKFDLDKTLTKATELFWKEGYGNTSLKQLLSAMNMGESSFYHTFKSKKALYLQCLKHYNNVLMIKPFNAISSNGSAKERIYGFFNEIIIGLETCKTAGCLFSNSLTKEVLVERDIKKYLFLEIGTVLDHFSDVVEESISDGDFNKELNPNVASKILVTYLHGMFRLSLYSFDGKKQRLETKTFLDSVLL